MAVRGRQQAWRQMQGALYHPVSGWREEMLTYFETDIPITNAFT